MITRRALVAAGVVAAVTSSLTLAACGGSSLTEAPTPARVKIGLLVSLSGIYKSVGEDMRKGAELYLSTHGNKLGGHEVDLIVADEGDGGNLARPAAEKLIKQDKVLALAGIVGGGTVNAVKPLIDEARIPLIGANGRPTTMENVTWVWHTSYISTDPGVAMGEYVHKAVDGPVYAIGPDYQGGWDELKGFTDTFTAAGGRLANPDGKTKFTPFPATTNFQPYLADIEKSGAKAVYCFYAGKAAIDFVMQYKQFGLAGKVPLYAAGFLTEGSVLTPQGDAAKGIKNSLNYAADLDNPTNRSFVAAYQGAHNTLPTTFAMSTYDAMAVLDRAIGAAGAEVTAEKVNQAVGSLGQIDSPRGAWQFNPKTHSPVQRWYLREVRLDGPTLTNVVVQELPTIGG